jgi:hypothetical protein
VCKNSPFNSGQSHQPEARAEEYSPFFGWNDVWYPSDGREWRQLHSKVIWKERHEHSTYVFKDKIWIAGGHAQPLSSEVWSLEIPPDWFDN